MGAAATSHDVVVVGAGFGGLYALYRLRQAGYRVQVFEAGADLGGTWYWNRYPGARCDVQSLEYSYQFSEELQQEWHWTEKYAPQQEILAYARHVAERFDLRKDICFNTRVVSLHFDNKSGTWHGKTENGDDFSARFCIMATGCLSKPNIPEFEGLDEFQGELLQTSRWPDHEVDFSGKRVGIIGTGSSALQAIPIIASQAAQLLVFQRTATFTVPAHNAPMDPDYEREVKAHYAEFREQNSRRYAAIDNRPSPDSALELSDPERQQVYERRWQEGGLPFLAAFNDLGTTQAANDTAADFVRGKIREIVKDPAVAELLSPHQVLGCKRLCVDTDYYQTFNRDNVTLVDVASEPIVRITPDGLATEQQSFKLDTLILATGFDAMTGALLDIDIRGKHGLPLREKWQAGPSNYLGLSVSGFPNLFMITGPGSPSVLANMIVGIEQHVNWIADLLDHMEQHSLQVVEAEPEAEADWVGLVNHIAAKTLYVTGCNSWYLGANIPGKPRIFMPYLGFPAYVEKCSEVAAENYRGFSLS